MNEKTIENTILIGDVLDKLKELSDGSIDCVVTSPPYWGLRAYQSEPQIWGGQKDCPHEWSERPMTLTHDNRNFQKGTQEECLENAKGTTHIMSRSELKQGFCRLCGAWRGEFGLEPSPELYVQHSVEIFREVKRILKTEGTLWLNLGDSYAGSGKGEGGTYELSAKQNSNRGSHYGKDSGEKNTFDHGLKPKDLVGIPWSVAFALRADGWFLRSDIIWAKPNPMPESVTDRPTKAHEYIFLLTKSPHYFFDQEAVREETVTFDNSIRDRDNTKLNNTPGRTRMGGLKSNQYTGRNIRSVWTITTQPYRDAHFATFPETLPERCIKAGCPKGGIVLDPFCGSGTTLKVAQDLGRRWIGIELKPEYVELAYKRIRSGAVPLKEFEANA